jgi:HD-like signal output (HDOD) protein
MSTATITAAAVLALAKECKEDHEYAIKILKLVSNRIKELATHPSVDMVELQAVDDELNASIKDLAAGVPKA